MYTCIIQIVVAHILSSTISTTMIVWWYGYGYGYGYGYSYVSMDMDICMGMGILVYDNNSIC